MNTASADPRPMRFQYADTRRWVMLGTGLGALSFAGLAIVEIVLHGWDPSRQQPRLILTALACAAGSVLALRGRVFHGGLVGLVALWCEVHYSLATSQTFPSPSLLASAVVMVVGVLLLRPRQSFLLALGTVAVTWALVIVSPAVQATGITSSVLYWLSVQTASALTVWSLVTFGFSLIDRAYLEISLQERELVETIERAPDGILVLDANDLVQVVNPSAERLLGQTRDECIGRSLTAVFDTGGVLIGSDSVVGLSDTGEHPHPMTVQRADAPRRELEVTWRAMEGGRRQLVLRDISERLQADRVRHEMELQLAHAQRLEAVGQLAGGIAHDFNNILTIVGASAEVLRSELPDGHALPLLDDILAAQERGATLTRQLLAFARREVVHPRVFDLSAQVLALRQLLQRVSGEQTRISCDVEPDCRIRADVGQVEQALVNLVSNARDAMPNGGTCALTVARITNDGEPWVRLRVADEGIGMDDATRARAFEPFFTTKPRGRGTGLGLSAVHGMALQSGGRADIVSAPGVGTTVVLDFAFVDAPVTVLAKRPLAVQTSSGATILVAEDDDGTRAVVARVLQRLGYIVLLAPDGLQALRMAEAQAGRVDLVLTDVMMPGLSGPQLAARLHERYPDVPVLFMSGYPEDLLAEVPGLHLETDFIAKPFAGAALAARVAGKLAGRPLPSQQLVTKQ